MMLCEPCLYFLFETNALKYTTSGQAGIVSSLEPVLLVIAARIILKEHQQELYDITSNYLKELGYDKDFEINYGYNYFPKKKYKGVTYDAGNYESLVITLGDGNGDNFWCVLFPPLCLLEADDSTTETEYKFFVKELIEKYIKK